MTVVELSDFCTARAGPSPAAAHSCAYFDEARRREQRPLPGDCCALRSRLSARRGEKVRPRGAYADHAGTSTARAALRGRAEGGISGRLLPARGVFRACPMPMEFLLCSAPGKSARVVGQLVASPVSMSRSLVSEITKAQATEITVIPASMTPTQMLEEDAMICAAKIGGNAPPRMPPRL